jgi:hypothetical protein
MRFSARSFGDACRAAASCASVAGSAALGAVPCARQHGAQGSHRKMTPDRCTLIRGGDTSRLPVLCVSPTLMGRASRVRPRPPRRKRSGEEQHTCRSE